MLRELIIAELAADDPKEVMLPEGTWSKTTVPWVQCTRGRVTYRMQLSDTHPPGRMYLKLADLTPELVMELHVPISGHRYVGWARGNDKQVARRIVQQVNDVLKAVFNVGLCAGLGA